MPIYSHTYPERIYDHFKSIEQNKHSEMIRFFDRYKSVFPRLEEEQHFEIMLWYLRAIFERGAYEKFIDKVDEVISYSMAFDYCEFEGIDVFQYLLFRKAASFYHVEKYEEASQVLIELVKIDPDNKIYNSFLQKVYRKNKPYAIQIAKAASVFLFLCGAVLIGVEILYVKNFYINYSDTIEWGRNLIFSIGVFTILSGEGLHRFFVYKKVNRLSRQQRKKKKQRF